MYVSVYALEFQSSRELLLSFSCKYLGGEGDIIRHLAHLGYSITHKQVFDVARYSWYHSALWQCYCVVF